MSKLKKIIIIVISAFFIIFIIGGFIAGNYFYNLALNSSSDKSIVFNSEHNQNSNSDAEEKQRKEQERQDWFKNIGYTDEYTTSSDQLKLHAYTIKNTNPTNKWVIIFHGYSSQASSMLASAMKFYQEGYNILLPDARGHGQSEGDYIGMGWDDRLDAIGWIDTIVQNNPDSEIILYGVSMGGATVMMISGEKLPSNVKAIVEDCGYTSVWDEFSYQLKEIFGLPSFPVMNFASLVTKIRAGYTLGEASALKQIKKSTTPILFIHGDSDTFVPSHMLDTLYNAAPSPKEKLSVPGAGHGEASSVEEAEYWNTVFHFIAKYIEA
jgi:fermentation-respiration switch protein FrsA (DUF1100 family)